MMVYRCGSVFFVVAFTLERRYCLTCDCYRFQNALQFSKHVLCAKLLITLFVMSCFSALTLFCMRFSFCAHSTNYFCRFSVPFPPHDPFLEFTRLTVPYDKLRSVR